MKPIHLKPDLAAVEEALKAEEFWNHDEDSSELDLLCYIIGYWTKASRKPNTNPCGSKGNGREWGNMKKKGQGYSDILVANDIKGFPCQKKKPCE